MIQRQPFSGPGMVIRILDNITKDRLNVLPEGDKITIEEIKIAYLYNKL
jgi:GMP synthase PP-ATPase subunit